MQYEIKPLYVDVELSSVSISITDHLDVQTRQGLTKSTSLIQGLRSHWDPSAQN